MSWALMDYIDNAYRSLRRSRMRTFLTTLGVAIGVASVTAILALSGGLTEVVNRQLDKLGGNLIVVRPGTEVGLDNPLTAPANQQNYTTSTLSEADVELVSGIEGVDAVAPLMTLNATLKTDTQTITNNTVVATTPDFIKISMLEVRDGQFLEKNTHDHMAVLGHQLAVDLFGTEKPIGLTFTIRGERFTVVGVLKPSMDPVNYNRVDFDNTVILSFGMGKTLNQDRTQIQQIDVRVRDVSQLDEITGKIQQTILTNHSGEQDFNVVSGKAVSATTSDLMRAITGVMTAIAAISLVVGGVGIMNIMLVGVAERTREIGIRKAVGATNVNIAMQFMTESVIMSLIGGFFGYLIGYVAAFGISTLLYFVPSVTWEVAVCAFVMALAVGLLFGFYPALRAARKHPIESLRQYH